MASRQSTVPSTSAQVTIRRAKQQDGAACGRIAYDAFHAISTAHAFPPDLPSPEAAAGLLSNLFSHPGYYCAVAEVEGRLAGSNCLDERSVIYGIGPITVDPAIQNRGIGRRLMQAVLDRVHQRQAPGVRLVQAAFHNRSLSLYATMGFDVREPLAVMQGPAINATEKECTVRLARISDLDECNRVCRNVHGHDRGGALNDAIKQGTAVVVERGGKITGYSSQLAFFGHTACETNVDLQALLGAAESFGGPGILVPTRNSALFRWCLAHGLRVTQPMTLMTIGLYNEPVGAYLPSILY
jgi:predicted N-acetyltransferase YhbS